MHLSSLLSALHIPSDFARYGRVSEPQIIYQLELWKSDASRFLSKLKALVEQHDPLPLEDRANAICSAASFIEDASWVSRESKIISLDILHLESPSRDLLNQILTCNIKPLFISAPHPHINLSTGRKLARPAGGVAATHDFVDDRRWKEHLGAPYILLYVVRNLKSEDYESLWHLLIPPVMTLLDDYQPSNKLLGVQVVSEILRHVPKHLLKRTGLDLLLTQSLTTCMGLVREPESPALLRATISVWISLTRKASEPGSTERFDMLCVLLGEHIIGSVWLYGSSYPDVIVATVESLPPLVMELGIGTARFLKAVMYQLLHPIQTTEVLLVNPTLQLKSLETLLVIIDQCRLRMEFWKGAILNAVARCYVITLESSANGIKDELLASLRSVCQALAKACPSVEQDFLRLRSADEALFSGLVPGNT